jgi:hypothetical protein
MTDLADFDRFTAVYPRPEGIGGARRQWLWALAAADNKAQEIIKAAVLYADYCRREGIERRYIPLPAKWLAEERWKDKLPEPPKKAADANLRARASTVAKGLGYLIRGSLTRRELEEMVRLGLLTREQAEAEPV